MKRLEDMTLAELWELFPIIICEHKNEWSLWAQEEIESLQSVFGSLAKIHHIGSTAIRDIWAKPIIDLLIVSDNKSNFLEIKRLITAAGYMCMAESDTRIDFNKGYTPQGFASKVFHAHLRLDGDTDEIIFRDYLNTYPMIAKEYEKLKLKIWKTFKHDRDGYTEAKTEFVKYYTQLAKSQIKQ